MEMTMAPTKTKKANAFQLLDLPEISLHDLAQRAELLKRTDRKYLVPGKLVVEMVDFLGEIGAQALTIGGVQIFGYLSDYYDTSDFALYRAAATKRRRRFKLRSRVYLDSGMHFMELKTRSGRGQNVKDRLRLEDVCTYDFVNGANDPSEPLKRTDVVAWASKLLQQRGVVASQREGFRTIMDLMPSSRSSYRRSTLCLPDDSRLTIDQDLVLSGPGESSGFEVPEVVVETKSSGRTSDADRWLWSHGIRPSRVSKYAIGTAIVHPELPANRWHSTMSKLGIRR